MPIRYPNCGAGFHRSIKNGRCVPIPANDPQRRKDKVSFESGKPVCSSGAALQNTVSVRKHDGTWTTVSVEIYCPKKTTL